MTFKRIKIIRKTTTDSFHFALFFILTFINEMLSYSAKKLHEDQ
jgi:hypothetical protein